MELYTPLTVNTVRKNYFLNASFLPSLTIEKAHVPSASPTPKSKTTQDIFVKLGSEGNQTGLPNLTLARTLQQHHLQVTSPTSNITNKTTPSQVTAGGKVPKNLKRSSSQTRGANCLKVSEDVTYEWGCLQSNFLKNRSTAKAPSTHHPQGLALPRAPTTASSINLDRPFLLRGS